MLAALNLSRRHLLGALAAAPLLAVALVAVLVVGRSRPVPSLQAQRDASTDQAGPGRDIPAPQWPSSHQTAHLTHAQLQADPEATQSFAQSRAQVHHQPAAAPSTAAVAPGAPSDAEVRAELRQMQRALHGVGTTVGGARSVGGDGSIPIPAGVPPVIQRVIAGGNAIATFPYIWGGGHGSFVDTGYDCSGSVSYALAAGGLLRAPETSGALMSWGVPGPGRYITVYANDGHVWMIVDGMRFDTSGRSGVHGSRWQGAARSTGGFAVRHWPGL